MAKDAERKRKLEQAEQEATVKRLKQSTPSSVKVNGKEPASAKDSQKLSKKEEKKEDKKKKAKRESVQNGDADVSMADADKKELAKVPGKAEGSTVDAARKTDKKQRALEKKARRKAGREVKAGLREDGALTAPNEHGWWLSPPSAGRYLPHDAIFVRDENGDECLIAATVREVQLLHLDSSLIVRTHIVPDGRSVLCFSLSATYPDHVDISYDNGAKVQWNWTSGSAIKGTFPGQETIIAMTTANMADGRPDTFYIAQTQGTYTIVGGQKALYSTYRRLRSIQVLEGAQYIIGLGTTALVIGRRKGNGQDYVWTEMPTTIPLQCIDARLVKPIASKGKQTNQNPNLVLAIGNSDGQIHLFSDLASLFESPEKAQLPSPRILHWHREAVSTVKFSRDGNYLISGGKESVLVIWQLETGHKQFLPHLTSEIERLVVSPAGNQYALQLGDNSIMVLSTTELKPVANFAGLQLPTQNEQSRHQEFIVPATTAVLHPQHPDRLLLTVPSTQPKHAKDITTRPFLQTFDIRNARHIHRQALSRNNVTDFNRGPENTPIIPPDVNLLAISSDGNWLATVDEWFPPATDLEHAVAKTTNMEPHDLAKVQEQQLRRREVYLKFWHWDHAQEIWTLSTRADAPHSRHANADLGSGAGRVLELKSDPASNGFATVGEDGQVKLWKPKTKTRHGVALKEQNGDDVVEWACRKTVALPLSLDVDERADSPMDGADGPEKPLAAIEACLAFSQDGSILACSTITNDETTQPIVHFISPEAGTVTETKSGIIPADQDVQDLGFLDRYLIVLTLSSVRVWNLVDDSHHYTIALQGAAEDQEQSRLAISQTEQTFAVASTISIPESDIPVPQLEIYSPERPVTLFEAELESMPATILSVPDKRGYTIVFEDGTIRSLSSVAPTTKERRLSLPAIEEIDNPTMEAADISPSSALALIKNEEQEEDVEIADGMAPLSLGGVEDDRRVVRPEELASIFDVGQSFALPSVKDMFRDVVELYARKRDV